MLLNALLLLQHDIIMLLLARGGLLLALQATRAPPITPLPDNTAYHDALASTADDTGERISVIEFSSSKCHACANMRPRIERMAQRWPEVEWHEIRFEGGGNRELFKSLGIKKLPHVQIARRGQAIDSFACPADKVRKIEDRLVDQGLERAAKRRWLKAAWKRLDARAMVAPAVGVGAVVWVRPWKLFQSVGALGGLPM